MASQIMVFLLMVAALIVAIGLFRKRNMWKWISAYWVLLTIKNFIDFLGVF